MHQLPQERAAKNCGPVPDPTDWIQQWKEIAASANKRRSATSFRLSPTHRRGSPGSYSQIDVLVEWSRTARSGRQFDLSFQAEADGGCTSTSALQKDGAMTALKPADWQERGEGMMTPKQAAHAQRHLR